MDEKELLVYSRPIRMSAAARAKARADWLQKLSRSYTELPQKPRRVSKLAKRMRSRSGR